MPRDAARNIPRFDYQSDQHCAKTLLSPVRASRAPCGAFIGMKKGTRADALVQRFLKMTLREVVPIGLRFWRPLFYC